MDIASLGIASMDRAVLAGREGGWGEVKNIVFQLRFTVGLTAALFGDHVFECCCGLFASLSRLDLQD